MQPVSGYNYQRFLTGAGTTVLAEQSCNLHSIINVGTLAGTINFYDSNTAAGTTTTNNFYNFVGTVPIGSTILDIQTKKGLIAVTSGTLNVTVTTE